MERREVDILCVPETRWKGEIYNVVLWKRKQKEWYGNHIEKKACGQGSRIVESNRQDNMLEDET